MLQVLISSIIYKISVNYKMVFSYSYLRLKILAMFAEIPVRLIPARNVVALKNDNYNLIIWNCVGIDKDSAAILERYRHYKFVICQSCMTCKKQKNIK